MVTYELIPKNILDDVLEQIEAAKIIILYAEQNNPNLGRANIILEDAYIKVQMNRTGCNIQPGDK